ncbi:hypothetical protein DEI93_06680 [Curtobacterium sp. MCBD17_035]|uniref:hypothetical protein n=1 Tax=Curtobacterium sp. MCBD17_035 TaxID=2175673 RepID=UPI000DAA2ACB|nr:hypothetical protein [Curtobacterium sp. MCBD17_035]WIB68709.1 hypothetical protein DEI93_06680 [Curtobacterium sp. MCBD17_035]
MAAHAPGDGAHRPTRARRRHRWAYLVAGGVALVVLVGVGAVWVHRTSGAASTLSACGDHGSVPADDEAAPSASSSAPSAQVRSGTAVDSSTRASRDALRRMGGLGFTQGDQPMTLGSARLTTLFRGIAATGATIVRLDLNWAAIEPSGPDSYDLTHTLAVYRAATARGLTVLPVLTGVPGWASSAPGGCGPAFAAFMDRASPPMLAAGVRAVEIGNEVNITGMSPQAYTHDLLVPGARAFRAAGIAAGVTVGVISTGLAPARTGGGTWSPPDFLRGVYAAGGGAYLDAVGMHPYSWPDAPTADVAWNWLRGATDVRAVMVANGDADKAMWATEFGFPTNSDRGVSDAQQARYLAVGARIWGARAWAGPIVIYSYQDLDTGARDPEDNFGVRDTDGTAKPAYDVVRDLAAAAAAQGEG